MRSERECLTTVVTAKRLEGSTISDNAMNVSRELRIKQEGLRVVLEDASYIKQWFTRLE